MQLQQRINAFIKLGNQLDVMVSNNNSTEKAQLYSAALANNGWFSSENITHALQSWANALNEKNIIQWLSAYNIPETISEDNQKTVAIVMAGNIPLVGFHDFVSVLITGNKVLAKLSSNDSVLLPYVTQLLLEIEPNFKNAISFTKEKLNGFDAVIATGSNNTSRYFDYYFKKFPNIIRRNRNSVAVLTGEESVNDLELLSIDVFQYFGLGCRNVSKIFIPKNYAIDSFFNGMFVQKEHINNHKYINNYDYNKAVYLMSDIALLDNEFMLLKEDQGYSSPISVVFYEYYDDLATLQKKLTEDTENIQAVVSNAGIKDEVYFGKAQQPALWDYADGVDTIDFLLKLT